MINLSQPHSIRHSGISRLLRLLACSLSLYATCPDAAFSQQPVTQTASADTFNAEQLDALLAPIALYPDELLTQTLMAATYPLEVVEAARWVEDPAHESLSGDALTNALEPRPWDPSVKEATGTGAYAQRLVSTPGQHDGLYWPASGNEPESPLGPLVMQAQEEGYPGEVAAGKPRPYQGYYFRILKAQGPDAPGGAKDYVQAGQMTGGFALIAWPASFGASGIMTFQVNQGGVVYQRDLGPGTASLAAAITRFDPDLSWARVDIAQQ
jgi:Protein of unknown function (DUF2950)/Protein of unknown function (DUF3300)